VLYGTGAGLIGNGPDAGVGGATIYPRDFKVFIDSLQVRNVSYFGQAPGLVNNIFQLNFPIPMAFSAAMRASHSESGKQSRRQ
jgi:uncharacterized protein (TIGR03437 family)